MTPDDAKAAVNIFGFVKMPDILTAAEVTELINKLGEVQGAGRRGLLIGPAVAELAHSKMLALARPHLAPNARPVRAIYFDKSGEANWAVGWHQDVTLAVRARANADGFGPWSDKNGVPHVQAPAHFLEQMVTVRLHLDDCDENNGALRVLIGSHRFGRIAGSALARFSRECPEMTCGIRAGGALVLRPLLLHASSRSRTGGHRRVLHIEYAGFELPKPLQWHQGG